MHLVVNKHFVEMLYVALSQFENPSLVCCCFCSKSYNAHLPFQLLVFNSFVGSRRAELKMVRLS